MDYQYKILCIGAGYVGGSTMAVIAKKCPDIKVTVVDVRKAQIDAWNSDIIPIYEPGLEQVVKETRDRNLFFTMDIESAIPEAAIIFIAVNTPTKTVGRGAGRATDLQYWERAARTISELATEDKIIVEKSTLPVRTAAAIEHILNANEKHVHFEVISNPEFLAEGSAVKDLLEPDRVLIGSHKTRSGLAAAKQLVDIYSHWVPSDRIITTNLWSSELGKLTANAFLAQRISSINAISALCEKTGAEITEITQIIGADSRIGPKFLNAGIGFGGSCFKKDVLNLSYLCEYYGLCEVASYWESVVRINEWQTHRVTQRLLESMSHTLAGKRIALFGLSFKANTGDTRESPAITVVRDLLEEQACPVLTDPKAISNARHDLSDVVDKILFEDSPYKAAEGSYAVVVCTDWACYATLDWKLIYKTMKKPALVFDGRSILNPDVLQTIGFEVIGIGKGDSK